MIVDVIKTVHLIKNKKIKTTKNYGGFPLQKVTSREEELKQSRLFEKGYWNSKKTAPSSKTGCVNTKVQGFITL